MRVLITCGPASVSLDGVRRLTNLSTGELGTAMAQALVAAGYSVVCLRGVGAVYPPPLEPVEVVPFFGNEDLAEMLRERRGRPEVVLHAAALADFFPEKIFADGRELPVGEAGKIPSSTKDFRVHFRPATKVVGHLREWFSEAFLVGWKYEVEGEREDAIKKGFRLVKENGLDACVVNGPACGQEMIWVEAGGKKTSFPHRGAFVAALSCGLLAEGQAS